MLSLVNLFTLCIYWNWIHNKVNKTNEQFEMNFSKLSSSYRWIKQFNKFFNEKLFAAVNNLMKLFWTMNYERENQIIKILANYNTFAQYHLPCATN